MQITTQRVRPTSPAYGSYENGGKRTEKGSRISKRIPMESSIFVEGRMEGSRQCFSLASGGDICIKKDQKNLQSKPVERIKR